jgi:uncharacterized membrane protein
VKRFEMTKLTRRPLIVASIFLGLGLGGFVDGILLHQILQWHHMLSSAGFPPDSVANLEVNTFWDGLFHAGTWVLTILGVFLLWRAQGRRDVPWSTPALFAGLALGWGLFNFLEGLIDHEILGIHHVNETAPREQWIWWDLAFLVFGFVLLVAGWLLLRVFDGDAQKVPTGSGASDTITRE